MTISDYHQRQQQLSDEEIMKRTKAKEEELQGIFSKVEKPKVPVPPARIAVLGCADVRYIPLHQEMFSRQLGVPCQVTTFDITIDHLAGGTDVVQHDCTNQLPGGPYVLILAHVLLKFLTPDGQDALVRNAWRALRPGGLAILVNDTEEFTNGVIDEERIRRVITGAQMRMIEVPVEYGVAWVLKK